VLYRFSLLVLCYDPEAVSSYEILAEFKEQEKPVMPKVFTSRKSKKNNPASVVRIAIGSV